MKIAIGTLLFSAALGLGAVGSARADVPRQPAGGCRCSLPGAGAGRSRGPAEAGGATTLAGAAVALIAVRLGRRARR